ncbi:Structure-specific endonuclease subunit SLX1 [Rhizoctonia solani AG-1 IB]|uniref:Structure-specific endonuclease subunit SLX1 n=1 Tax=Thanatephorus cucumeris (strain AG1-IB / isolate 7/3/14) TaxID=1108050 RepID=M5BTF6_THACB|nr:Structure-specific endonuclease subunit SLX1 [Rhizoctonia solani AG-1 IB]
MLNVAPYCTWPLHIKIFTEEAKNLWDEIHRVEANEPIPEGFTMSVEFEGVDGRAFVPVSRRTQMRTGPIDVKDTKFNSSHILKFQSLVNERHTSCSVCSSDIDIKRMDHLRIALCPQGDCKAVAHLDCLAESFSKHPSNPPGLIPRGGTCKVCEQYTLWGDVIRGCYRRARGGLQQPTSEHELEEDEDEENAQLDDVLSRHLETLQIGGSSQKASSAPKTRATVSKSRSNPAPRMTKRRAQKAKVVDPDVEDFAAEMDAIECDTEDSEPAGPSRKQQKPAKAVQRTTKAAKAINTPEDYGKPRDIDEIVREALGNLSISAPGGSRQVHSVKPSDVARKPQRSTKSKDRVEVVREGRANRVVDSESAAPCKSKGRRTPSPEYINLDGI